MTLQISILDFNHPNLFTSATPTSIAGTSDIWAEDIRNLGPWKRSHAAHFSQSAGAWIRHPEKASDGPKILVCGHCTSTMDMAWHFIQNQHLKIWDSIIAVEQNAGRGQKKRSWISPAGNIHASWRWPLPEFPDPLKTEWSHLLPLMAGFVFCRIFKQLNVGAQIKWPNDLLINNRKFGGILVEKRENSIIVGIGINLNYAPEDDQLREEFAVPATHLIQQGHAFSPLALWMELITKGKLLFEQVLQTMIPEAFIKILDAQMAWVGKNVLIRQSNTNIFDAVILGLSEDGSLRIKKENLEEAIYSGSIIPI